MSQAMIEKLKRVMREVYGEYTGRGWKPNPYADNKSRYLWTDAFGVCNFITLYCETKDPVYLDQAEALIDDVHNTLGKDRSLTRRLGDSTDDHPLRGGLRIGKADEEGTRDGDGQYFHYLTKWMFALNRMSIVRNDSKYNDWAIELAKGIHGSFVRDINTYRPRMSWKMSIDLKRPLVNSEGNLDPFDGYITYRILADHASDSNILSKEIKTMEKIVNQKYKGYSSDDPLDLGEALWICHWYINEPWAQQVSQVSLQSLEYLYKNGYFNMPTRYRLAFREFGTTIGVLVNPLAGADWINRANNLNDFWEKYIYARDKDITPIMYCTSLIPGSFQKGYVEVASQP